MGKDNLFLGTSRFFAKNIPNYGQGNNRNSEGNLSQINLRGKINHFSANLSAITAKYKVTKAYNRLTTIVNGSPVTKIAINQTATKFAQIAENTFNCGLVGLKETFTKFILSKFNLC